MTKYYTKNDRQKTRLLARVLGLLLVVIGLIGALYFSFPILSYYVFLREVYASTTFETPIPTATIIKRNSLKSLVETQARQLSGENLSDAKTWFPNYSPEKTTPRVDNYTISIPKIKIEDAFVSTLDYDVSRHLINYGGTAIPPEKGNAVVFGHSTLPSLFNKNDYKTIFANLHIIEIGDKIEVKASGKKYTYSVISISVVDPNDFTPLSQSYDDSYLTLITCTPPGTIWQRLVVKAKLVE